MRAEASVSVDLVCRRRLRNYSRESSFCVRSICEQLFWVGLRYVTRYWAGLSSIWRMGSRYTFSDHKSMLIGFPSEKDARWINVKRRSASETSTFKQTSPDDAIGIGPVCLLHCVSWFADFFSDYIEWPYSHNNAVRKVATGGVSVGQVNDTRNSQQNLVNMTPTFAFFSTRSFSDKIGSVDVTWRTSNSILLVNFHTAMWVPPEYQQKAFAVVAVSRNSRFSMVERLSLHIHPWPPLFRFVVLFEASPSVGFIQKFVILKPIDWPNLCLPFAGTVCVASSTMTRSSPTKASSMSSSDLWRASTWWRRRFSFRRGSWIGR